MQEPATQTNLFPMDSQFFIQKNCPSLFSEGLIHCLLSLAAEAAAQTAENLPDGAASGLANGVAVKEKHLSDLLLSICL